MSKLTKGECAAMRKRRLRKLMIAAIMVVLAAAALNDSAEAIVTWHSEVADTGQQRVFDYMTKPLWELPRSGW
jgi:hypothetical protein